MRDKYNREKGERGRGESGAVGEGEQFAINAESLFNQCAVEFFHFGQAFKPLATRSSPWKGCKYPFRRGRGYYLSLFSPGRRISGGRARGMQ